MTPSERWTRRVVGWLVPSEWADEVVGDLLERQAAVSAVRGRLGGFVWLVRQLAAWAWAGLPRRLGAVLRSGVWESLRRDVRTGARRLLAAPLLSLAVICTLALGIGGTTAAWSVVDAVLLRAFPFERPDELYAVRGDRNGQSWWAVAAPELRAWTDHARNVDGVVWGEGGAATMSLGGQPIYVRTARVSPGFFEVLGVPPRLGRDFRTGEDGRGSAPVLILTHTLWQARFGADPDIVGRSVVLDDTPYTVVGVAPDVPVEFLGAHDLFVPRPMAPGTPTDQGRVLRGVVRAPPGSLPEDVAAELRRVMEAEGLESARQGWMPRLVPLRDEVVGNVRPVLLVLFGAVASVLLVACLNVTGLLLARAQARRAEAVVRRALGASRARLFGQALTEALLLAGLGGVAGLGVAVWGTDALVSSHPDLLPRGLGPGTRARAAWFAGALAASSGLLFGAASGWSFSGLRGTIDGTRGSTRPRGDGRTGSALVGAEIAFALLLLVGAGLMLRSLDALEAVDPGLRAEGALVGSVALSSARHPTLDAQVRALETLRTELSALPEVVAVGGITNLPFEGPGYTGWHILRSDPEPAPGDEPTGGVEMVSSGYFAAQGVALLAGRTFDAREAEEGRAVTVVNGTMARLRWPSRSPVGDFVRFGPTGISPWFEVVGVVDDVRYDLARPARPRFYVPERRSFGPLSLRTTVVRLGGDAAAAAPAVRAAFARALPDAPLVRLEPMSDVAAEALATARLQALLLSLFGMVGTGLGAVGVYGMVSFQVGRRTREVGLRMALGATRTRVVARVVSGILAPVGMGLAAGAASVVGFSGVLEGVVHGVDPRDPGVLLGLAALLLGVAVAAALVPALRAARLDPGRTLAGE